jgi:nucleoid DNA-binding protein
MATKKKPAAKAKTATKKPAAKKAAAKPAALKSVKTAFTKGSLVTHLAEQSGVEAKSVKAVLAALEGAALASVGKNSVGEFTLPGLLKVMAQKVPAKPKRFGKNPFTGEEQWFAAKPATVRVKVRPLKKLKDAAL